MSAVWDQMGINEMRRHFYLKQKSVRFDGRNEEEPRTPGSAIKALKYFQERDNLYTGRALFKFWPDEVDHAEIFFEQKFPGIRLLFRINFEEAKATSLTQNNIDTIERIFLQVKKHLYNVGGNMLSQSQNILMRNTVCEMYKGRC